MKRGYAVVLMLFVLMFASKSFAGDSCGLIEMPIEVKPGEFFVSDATIRAMGGDITKPIKWVGDSNYWREEVAQKVSHEGVSGVLVSGIRDDFHRWNLRQDGHPNSGWLPIEDAFPLYGCPNIYTPGRIDPDGRDRKGKGPAFWYVEPVGKITFNLKKD